MMTRRSSNLLSLLCLSAMLAVAGAFPSLRSMMHPNKQAAGANTTTTTAANNSTMTPAHNSTMAHNSTAADQKKGDLPACRDSFPPSQPKQMASNQSTSNASIFETNKEEPSYKRKVATLAPCLLEEGKCQESVTKVDNLSGALASVTQQLYNTAAANATSGANTTMVNSTTNGTPAGSNSTMSMQQTNATTAGNSTSGSMNSTVDADAFAKTVANSTELKDVVQQYGSCITTAPGGVDSFLQKYSQTVKDILANGTVSNSTVSNSTTTSSTNNQTRLF